MKWGLLIGCLRPLKIGLISCGMRNGSCMLAIDYITDFVSIMHLKVNT